MNELDKLRKLLDAEKIPYENKSIRGKNDGISVCNGLASIISNQYSYGGDEGFCEIMADFIKNSVQGYLIAEECLWVIKNRKELKYE